ncbi:hypothetical protein BGY98DRAFT_938556 [Russula aff. rugulosa BPL654]|nr:hypothetical protein BGY98DRAFT_938556 [Russula aff. rugulosa BPL654]
MSQVRSPGQIIDVRIDQRTHYITSLYLDLVIVTLTLAVDGHWYPPQPAQDQTSKRLSHSSDSSIALFTLYLRISEEHDRRKYELLKGELDSILVFCGLFSATVAALSMPSIQPPADGQDSFSYTTMGPLNITNSTLSTPLTTSLQNYTGADPPYFNILDFQHLLRSRSISVAAIGKAKHVGLFSSHSLPEQARMGAYFTRRIERANKTVRNIHHTIIFSLLVFFSSLLCYFSGAEFVNADFYYASVVSLSLIATYPFYILYKSKKISRPGFPHCTLFTQEKIKEQGSRHDGELLKRTLDISRSDNDLEQFFEAIPGFCVSKIVDNPRRSLDVLGLPRLAEALIGFWNRTLSSNRVSESVKVRRLVVCVGVIGAADLSIAVPHIFHLLSGDFSEVSRSLKPVIPYDPCAMAMLLRFLLQHDLDLTRKSSSILSSLSKFDILNTLPELQRDFCHLWNEVVQQARSCKADDNPFIDILVEIRRLYVDLHGTDIALGYFFTSSTGHDDLFHQPTSYPLCTMQDHHPKSTTPTQEANGNTTCGDSQIITAASPILSESSPGDILDVSHHTATGMAITQGIRVAETCIPQMAEPVAQSPSSTGGDQPLDEGITSFMPFTVTLLGHRSTFVRNFACACVFPTPYDPIEGTR